MGIYICKDGNETFDSETLIQMNREYGERMFRKIEGTPTRVIPARFNAMPPIPADKLPINHYPKIIN